MYSQRHRDTPLSQLHLYCCSAYLGSVLLVSTCINGFRDLELFDVLYKINGQRKKRCASENTRQGNCKAFKILYNKMLPSYTK